MLLNCLLHESSPVAFVNFVRVNVLTSPKNDTRAYSVTLNEVPKKMIQDEQENTNHLKVYNWIIIWQFTFRFQIIETAAEAQNF